MEDSFGFVKNVRGRVGIAKHHERLVSINKSVGKGMLLLTAGPWTSQSPGSLSYILQHSIRTRFTRSSRHETVTAKRGTLGSTDGRQERKGDELLVGGPHSPQKERNFEVLRRGM